MKHSKHWAVRAKFPYELAYCEGELLNKYLYDMEIMQDFADWNRQAIADIQL